MSDPLLLICDLNFTRKNKQKGLLDSTWKNKLTDSFEHCTGLQLASWNNWNLPSFLFHGLFTKGSDFVLLWRNRKISPKEWTSIETDFKGIWSHKKWGHFGDSGFCTSWLCWTETGSRRCNFGRTLFEPESKETLGAISGHHFLGTFTAYFLSLISLSLSDGAFTQFDTNDWIKCQRCIQCILLLVHCVMKTQANMNVQRTSECHWVLCGAMSFVVSRTQSSTENRRLKVGSTVFVREIDILTFGRFCSKLLFHIGLFLLGMMSWRESQLSFPC